nr:hypothetical protein [Tanacetum cinerariifolium]
MLESMKDIQIQMTILKEILEGCILSDTKDRWTWSLEGSEEFSVSSIRKTVDAAFLPCGNVKTRLKKAQENDKIRSKPDKNGKRSEARKC